MKYFKFLRAEYTYVNPHNISTVNKEGQNVRVYLNDGTSHRLFMTLEQLEEAINAHNLNLTGKSEKL